MTRQGKIMLWGVGVTLLVAIGALWALGHVGPDITAIKAELEMRIEELNKIAPEEAIRLDDLAEELLENEEYKQHAKALWLKVERLHKPIHDAAQLERAALKEVPPFLARSKDVSKVSRADLELLIGEARAHVNNYGTTRFAEPLRKRLAELTAKLESMPKPVTAPEIPEQNRKVQEALRAGRFSDAWDLVEEFMKRPGAREFGNQIDPSLDSIKSKAAAAARTLFEKIKRLMDGGDKAAALQVVERSAPDFRRFKDEAEKLETLRRQLTPR
jgi:hypothetical protein